MGVESSPAPFTGSDANPRSELDLENLWQRNAQAFLSFLPNNPLRASLTRRLEEIYASRHDLENPPLLEAQRRIRIKTQVQECGEIMVGLLNDRLDQEFRKEILERYGNERIREVKDISMKNKVDFAAQKGFITKKLKKQVCDIYRLRNNIHPDREIRTNYIPSTSNAQKAFETLEQFTAQLKASWDKPKN